MTGLTADDIREITQAVWSTQLGIELDDEADGKLHPRDFRDAASLTGSIQISGAASGAVHLFCTRELASRAAAAMFGRAPGELAPEEVRDAAGELVNVIAGNLKALLPGDNFISLPTVVQGTDYDVTLLASEPLHEVAFRHDGEPLLVTVFVGRPGAQG